MRCLGRGNGVEGERVQAVFSAGYPCEQLGLCRDGSWEQCGGYLRVVCLRCGSRDYSPCWSRAAPGSLILLHGRFCICAQWLGRISSETLSSQQGICSATQCHATCVFACGRSSNQNEKNGLKGGWVGVSYMASLSCRGTWEM